MTAQTNATFINLNSKLNKKRGYATLHKRQNGEWFTIIDIDDSDLYCEDWEVEFDGELPTRTQVNW